MDPFTVFLRTALFSTGGAEAHVPAGAMIVEGNITDRPSGAIVVETTRLRDARGRELGESKITLQIPMSKIDHIVHNG